MGSKVDASFDVDESLKLGSHNHWGDGRIRSLQSLTAALLPSFPVLKRIREDLCFSPAGISHHGLDFCVSHVTAMGFPVEVLLGSRSSKASFKVPNARVGNIYGFGFLDRLGVVRSGWGKAVSRNSSTMLSEYLRELQHCRYDQCLRLFSTVEPGLLVVDFDRHAINYPVVCAAKHAGWKTATLMHSTPNRNFLPFLADSVLVWGASQAEWAARNGAGEVHLVGRPDLDACQVRHRGAIRRVVYLDSGEELGSNEVASIGQFFRSITAEGIRVIFRLHPAYSQPSAQWDEQLLGVELSSGNIPLWDFLTVGDLVATRQSSGAFEAAARGYQSIVVSDHTSDEFPDLNALKVTPEEACELTAAELAEKSACNAALAVERSLVASGASAAHLLQAAVEEMK